MRFECWKTKATNTNSEYVTPIGFSQQQWLGKRASVLLYTYMAHLVISAFRISQSIKWRVINLSIGAYFLYTVGFTAYGADDHPLPASVTIMNVWRDAYICTHTCMPSDINLLKGNNRHCASMKEFYFLIPSNISPPYNNLNVSINIFSIE